jgi:hypothetical protein
MPNHESIQTHRIASHVENDCTQTIFLRKTCIYLAVCCLLEPTSPLSMYPYTTQRTNLKL